MGKNQNKHPKGVRTVSGELKLPTTLEQANKLLIARAAADDTKIESRARELADEYIAGLSSPTASADLQSAQTEIANLKAQLAAGLGETGEVQTIKGQLASVRNELAEVRGELAVKVLNLSRLESLCGVKGIDPAAAVAVRPAVSAEDTLESFEAEMKAAKTPAERAQIVKRLDAARDAGRLRKS